MEKEQPWKKLKHIWEKKESYLSAQNSIEVLNLLFINEKKKKIHQFSSTITEPKRNKNKINNLEKLSSVHFEGNSYKQTHVSSLIYPKFWNIQFS